MPKCKSCQEPIKWGMGVGGKWIALEPEPHPEGDLAFLPGSVERIMKMDNRWRSLEDIPSDLAATIPDHMRDWWDRLLTGPRYRIHSIECQRDVAQSIGYLAQGLVG